MISISRSTYPASFLASPSTKIPNGFPSASTILPSLFTVLSFKMDKSGTSASGASPSGTSPSGFSPSGNSLSGTSGFSPSAPSGSSDSDFSRTSGLSSAFPTTLPLLFFKLPSSSISLIEVPTRSCGVPSV